MSAEWAAYFEFDKYEIAQVEVTQRSAKRVYMPSRPSIFACRMSVYVGDPTCIVDPDERVVRRWLANKLRESANGHEAAAVRLREHASRVLDLEEVKS